MKKLGFLWLILAISGSAVAQKYSNEFLRIGVGARAQGMGNAQIASVNDVTSVYWNPAGMMQYKGALQMGLMHSEWFAGIGKYDYLGGIYPLEEGKRTVGMSIIRFGVDNIPNTLSLYDDDGTVRYDKITSFSSADYAVQLSYAQNIGDNGLSVGSNLKVVHRRVGPFARAWGFGLDAGAQYQLGDVRLAAMIYDVTGTFNAWKFRFTQKEKETLALTNNEIPISSLEVTKPRITLGAAYKKEFGKFGITAETNFNLTTDGKRNVLIKANPVSIDPNIGLEMSYAKLVFLRGGVNNFQTYTDNYGKKISAFQPNIGAGLQYKGVRLDYAFSNIGNMQGLNTYSHIVSLVFDINYKKIGEMFESED